LIVTLLTDFGLKDHYVAALKGVILSHDPRIRIVDITHDVPPFDLLGASYLLSACHAEFPPGTVHLVVVDPGVGSSRRAIAVAAQDRFFVGPDNGVLALSLNDVSPRTVVEIDPRTVARRGVSATFHGRDLFAPAAAALATGTPITDLGPVRDSMVESQTDEPRYIEGQLCGVIVHVDRFGNCVTNLKPSHFPGGDWSELEFGVGGRTVVETRRFYAERAAAQPFMIGRPRAEDSRRRG
jgi:S-adenosylmethionine hydrolase